MSPVELSKKSQGIVRIPARKEVGGIEKDRLLHLFDIGMEQVHGLVHMAQFETLAGWQVDGGQPAIPYPEFGFRHAEPVGDHGEQGSLQLCTCRLFNGFEALFQTQPFPKDVYDKGTAQGESLLDFHVGRQADGNCRILSYSRWIIKPQTTNATNGLAETHQLLAVELVNSSEVVDDFGNGFASVRMPLVMGKLEVFDDRAVLVGALCDS